MASKKEITKHVKIALAEVGKIKPRFSKKFNAWIFRHPAYPDVEYAGETRDEVVKNYPKYLREFIKQRLDANISEHVETKTKGRGGKREGAGRPKGTKKEPTLRISLPVDLVHWLHQPDSIVQFRQFIACETKNVKPSHRRK